MRKLLALLPMAALLAMAGGGPEVLTAVVPATAQSGSLGVSSAPASVPVPTPLDLPGLHNHSAGRITPARPVQPQLSRGGPIAGKQNLQDLTVTTPSPTPLFTGSSHSSAVLSAPGESPVAGVGGGRAVPGRSPSVGNYSYSVTGTESAEPF